MLKMYKAPNGNISESVEFLLRGAKKRRSMALASAKMINSNMGINTRLFAIK